MLIFSAPFGGFFVCFFKRKENVAKSSLISKIFLVYSMQFPFNFVMDITVVYICADRHPVGEFLILSFLIYMNKSNVSGLLANCQFARGPSLSIMKMFKLKCYSVPLLSAMSVCMSVSPPGLTVISKHVKMCHLNLVSLFFSYRSNDRVRSR